MIAVLTTTVLLCAPATSESEVNQWLQRAEQSAARVRTAQDEFNCWALIGRVYSRRKDIDGAMGTVARITDDDWRRMAAAGLAREAADRGALEEARLILERLADHRLRNDSLYDVASIVCLQHNFVAAERLCRLLDDARLQQELWYGLAAEEALAGQYDLALSTARQVGASGEWQRARLLEFIQSCRQRGACCGPQHITADLPEKVFSLDGMGWMPSSEDISTHQMRMRESSDPIERAISSTRLARWHQGRNETARCRFALATAADSLPAIRENRERFWCCAELVETMRRAGLSAEAKTLADKIITRDTVASVLKQPDLKETDVFALPPKLVFVLIRLGRTEDAFEIAGSASGLLLGADTWWAAGIACALEGKTDEVQRRLVSMDRDKDKAILAAGVALALQELVDQERTKTRK
jgi:tetratricopeptide (TPR) repeat protein